MQQDLSDGGLTNAGSTKNPHVLADASSTAESGDAEDVDTSGSMKHRLALSAGGSRDRQEVVATSRSKKRRRADSGGGSGN